MRILKNILRWFVKGLLVILIIIFIAIAILLIIRNVKRAYLLKDLTINTPNGIDEAVITKIGDINQYLYIRGEDQAKPVILFLHGGPGSPMTPLLHTFQPGLEADFTIVQWEQRNTGKTYYLNDPKAVYETLSIEQMVEDTKDVVIYLRERFAQEKIIIMGHSWGSALGTAFVQAYPQYVKAYIAMGVVTNTEIGDEFAFLSALNKAKLENNKKDIMVMENLTGYQISDPQFNKNSFNISRKMVSKYLMSDIDDHILRDLFFSPCYNLKDLSFFLKDTFKIQKPLMDELALEYNINNYGTNYTVPVFFILGEDDWITPTALATDFYYQMNAPQKELIIIEDAGHMMMLDQTQAFIDAVLDVLTSLE